MTYKFLVALVSALALLCTNCLSKDAVTNLKKERPESPQRPFLIEFNGEINWKLSKYLRAKIQKAKSAGADVIVLDIDSPGGLKDESLALAEMMRDIDWAYTVAFVDREALSGAALLTLGCDELMIAPLARYGDIGVIQFDPTEFAFRFASEKIQSVLINQARTLAESKGRPVELAEAMINKDFHVYLRQNNGELIFKGLAAEEDPPGPPWEIVEETKKGFLTVNGARAKELGIAQTLAADRQTVASKLGYDPKSAQILKYTTTDAVAYFLNLPLVTGLLILIGLIAFFLELSAPGIGFGGLVAGLCAALFFWSRFLGGTSTWLEVVLFTAGVAFLLMEVFVIPGWGVSGISGLLLIVASVFMASQEFYLPTNPRQWNQFLTTTLVLLCSGVLFVIAAAIIVRNIGVIPVFSKMILAPPVTETPATDAGQKPVPVTHPLVSVGDWGMADSLLRPAGRAVFAGRSIDVVSDGEFINPGQQVKVIEIAGNRIVVSSIADSSES